MILGYTSCMTVLCRIWSRWNRKFSKSPVIMSTEQNLLLILQEWGMIKLHLLKIDLRF